MKKHNILLLIIVVILINLVITGCDKKAEYTQENESSQLIKISFESRSLEKEMNVNIYLPRGYNTETKYPVLYMIHGYKDNEDCWMPNLELNTTADRLIDSNMITPVIIVMPQIDDSFGINTDKTKIFSDSFTTGMYKDYLIKDLISYIDDNFYTINNRDGRYIGGLSMGGYAALYLAFTYPDMFTKVGGHSPAVVPESEPVSGLTRWLYPTKELREERDPIYLASQKDLQLLKVYLDCGDRDDFEFYRGCEQLYNVLQLKGISSEYHFNEGEHNAAYWIANSEQYLLFYAGK
jgi:enterochelin esterase-like enzyme